jgi:hypothetical protein
VKKQHVHLVFLLKVLTSNTNSVPKIKQLINIVILNLQVASMSDRTLFIVRLI